MADISKLSRLLNGVIRNVDFETNTLVTASVKVGGATNTELTKTLLDKLVLMEALTDAAGKYTANDVLVAATASNYTAGSATVEAHLVGIDTALSTAGSDVFADDVFAVQNSVDATKQIAFSAASITTGNIRTITMPDANVNLGDIATNTAKVSADGSVTTHSNVTDAGSGIIISDAERTKLNGIEALATADQTGAEIKSAYEGEADTNAFTDAEQTKLGAIEALADVTDATNVAAAGAVMESDTSTASMSFVIDEDDMVSDSATKVPTQQSVKAYVASVVTSAQSYKGGYDAATDTPSLDSAPNTDIAIGDQYTVTVAGVFYTINVEVGDVLIAEVVDPTAEADWTIVNKNLDASSIKTSYESNADTNAFTDAEQTKLGAIETSATADQTDAEIKTAYENNADTNAFTDADETKLDGIEALAEVNQTDAEIKTAYENNANTNAFTDADKAALIGQSGSNTGDEVPATTTVAGIVELATIAETDTGTDADKAVTPAGLVNIQSDVDANTAKVSADGSVATHSDVTDAGSGIIISGAERTKLSGIETLATADQTGAEIKAAYEAEADTNAYTDAEKTKLAGVEALATADQTGAEIKAAYEAEADTNAFTDAEQTKLGAIEALATADQTDAEIKTAYENNADTNAYTDAEKTKLTGVEALADVTDATNVAAAGAVMESDTSTASMSFVIDEDDMVSDSATKVPTQQSVKAYVASVVTSSTSYRGGYDAATDTPSLDSAPNTSIAIGDQYTVTVAGVFYTINVEVGDVLIAEVVDPTVEADWTIVNKNLDASSIKTSYESNSDTNAFTDAEQTKLSNITGSNTGDEAAASDTVAGIVELATIAETDTGTATDRAVTPAGLVNIQSDVDANTAKVGFTDALAKAAAVADSITDAVTDVAPSQNAVFDALALKADVAHDHSRIVKSFVAGESFASNTTFMVRIALTGETAGRVYKADKDASTSNKFYAIGFIEGNGATAKTAGDSVSVILLGEITLGSSDTAFAAGEIGQAVHLLATGAFDAVSQITYATDEASYRGGLVLDTSVILVGNMQLLGIN